MMDNLENIDQLFREKLHGYAPPPPENGWDRLQAELSASKKVLLIPVWVRIAASVLIIAGTVALGWQLLKPSDKEAAPAVFAAEDTPPEVSRKSTEAATREAPAPVAIAAVAENTTSEGRTRILVQPDRTIADQNTGSPVLAAERESIEREQEQIFTGPETEIFAEAENTVITDVSGETLQYAEPRSIFVAAEDELPAANIERAASLIDINDLILEQNILSLQEEKDTRSRAAWSVGGLAGPQYTYRDVNVNTLPYPIDDYNNYESGVTTYAGGFQVEVEPAPRFSVQSGIYYSKIGQIKTTIEPDLAYSGIDVTYISGMYDNIPPRGHASLPTDLVNSTGNITFDKSLPPSVAVSDPATEWVPGNFTAEQYFEFIEVPLIIRYRIIDRKLDLNISGGVWANFLIGNKAVAIDNATQETTTGTTDDINTLNYCGSLSLGLSYPLGPHVAISLEPFVKYYLKPINSNPQTDVYPYSMGVMSGIKYSF